MIGNKSLLQQWASVYDKNFIIHVVKIFARGSRYAIDKFEEWPALDGTTYFNSKLAWKGSFVPKHFGQRRFYDIAFY